MPECRQQAFIDAPLDVVWDLASDPDRQTDWWPDTITFECIDGDFEQAQRPIPPLADVGPGDDARGG